MQMMTTIAVIATLFQSYGEMRLAVENPLILNATLVIGFLLLILVSLRQVPNSNVLSIEQTNQIKGISILLVVLYHLSIHTIENPQDLALFADVGFVGVALFLMMSGYGIAFSLKHKGTENFFSRRLGRLYVPILIAMLLRVILAFALDSGLDGGFLPNILNIFIHVNALDRNLWFIPFILFWYLVSYLVWRTNFSIPSKLFLLFCVPLTFYVVSPTVYLWQINAFSFPLGFCLGVYSEAVSGWLSRLVHGNLLRLTSVFLVCILMAQLLYHHIELGMRNFLILVVLLVPIGLLLTRSLQLFRYPWFNELKSWFSAERVAILLTVAVFATNHIIGFGDLETKPTMTLIFINLAGIFFSFATMLLILSLLRLSLYSRFLGFIGEISFELYLLHGMFMYKFDFVLFRGNIEITFFLYFAVTCFACLLLKQVSTLTLSKVGAK